MLITAVDSDFLNRAVLTDELHVGSKSLEQRSGLIFTGVVKSKKEGLWTVIVADKMKESVCVWKWFSVVAKWWHVSRDGSVGASVVGPVGPD